MESKLDKLKELGELLKLGVVTQEEFEQLKEETLDFKSKSKEESSSKTKIQSKIVETKKENSITKNIHENSGINANYDPKTSNKDFISVFYGLVILIMIPVMGIYFFNKNSDSINTYTPASSNEECSGYGDNGFIRNKLKRMNRDVVEISSNGPRKYYVRYIDWSTGTARNGDIILDYSNSPCND